jgi:hypothetical protein
LGIVLLGDYYFEYDMKNLPHPVDKTKPAAIDSNKQKESGQEQKDEKAPDKVVPDNIIFPKTKTIADVPFISQAPFGDWKDPLQQHGCEEASLIMARHWISGENLTPEIALGEILSMSEFEKEKYGGVYDLSISDTLKFWREYFGYKKSFVKYDISASDVKKEIAIGNLVIVPIDGTRLKNPHYTQPGPPRHEMVIVGYDDNKQEFITNDPGTRYGESYRYDYDNFVDSIRDYKTGFDEPVDNTVKAMLVIEKE